MKRNGSNFLFANQRFDDLVELGSEPSGSSVPAQPEEPQPQRSESVEKKPKSRSNLDVTLISGFVVVLIGITLFFWMTAQYRAENLTEALDPQQLQGLSFADREFNPYTEVKYVQVQEGIDRNPGVVNLGSTLPIISRFNYKTFTEKNYEIIGAAQWALTTNFESNLYDPEMMEYLLSNKAMIQAFMIRPDVEPLLTDPQMLLAFTEDNAAMRDFFEDSTVQAVMENEKMVHVVARSRFISELLTSPSGKYFREHPQEAAFAIRNNSYLMKALQYPHVQKEIKDTPYLKPIVSLLLERESPAAPKTVTQPAPKKVQTAPRNTSKTSRSASPRVSSASVQTQSTAQHKTTTPARRTTLRTVRAKR